MSYPGAPKGIRIPVTGLKGRCPRPLDDGGIPAKYSREGSWEARVNQSKQRTEVFQKYNDINTIRLLTNGWLINYNFFKQNEGCGNIPPAQAASKIVPCKDWNDIVIPEGVPDNDYQVRLSRRKSVKKGAPVYDAILTPTMRDKEGLNENGIK